MPNEARTHTSAPKPTLSAMPVVVLVLICVVAGVLLGIVHDITAPRALANAEAKAQQTYANLVPQAASFTEIDIEADDVVNVLQADDESGNAVAHICVAQAKGYGGPVQVAVAFDLTGTVMRIAVMDHSETPGLGTKACEDAYLQQYAGLPAEPTDALQIDLISGATITSTAVLDAFNTATAAMQEVHV